MDACDSIGSTRAPAAGRTEVLFRDYASVPHVHDTLQYAAFPHNLVIKTGR